MGSAFIGDCFLKDLLLHCVCTRTGGWLGPLPQHHWQLLQTSAGILRTVCKDGTASGKCPCGSLCRFPNSGSSDSGWLQGIYWAMKSFMVSTMAKK
eukprot:scaffold82211_cov16-Tisochrysis_lutea.AAC.2